MQLKGKLHWALHSLPVHILVDSGADENFIDLDLGQQFNLPLVVLPESRQVLALDGPGDTLYWLLIPLVLQQPHRNNQSICYSLSQ